MFNNRIYEFVCEQIYAIIIVWEQNSRKSRPFYIIGNARGNILTVNEKHTLLCIS